ncbi:hypothetical protein PTKIN_Ptkin01aG0018000 [Pterospermum kingtungense]
MGLRSVMVILVTFISVVNAMVGVATLAKLNCQNQCGDVTIPYPFGIGGDCNLNSNFSITCDDTYDPPKPFYGNIEVLNISLDGHLRILMFGIYDCYDQSGPSSSRIWASLQLAKFPINNTINKFTAIGCDTIAMVGGLDGPNYATGCLSLCSNISDAINGSCSGIGCCETTIPQGARSYNITLASTDNHSFVLSENPCSYAFLAEVGAYTFSNSDLRRDNFTDLNFPVTVDWTIGEINCSEAKKDTTNFTCMENSECVDLEIGGYLCNCLEGFDGNPYLSNGCQGTSSGLLCFLVAILLLYLMLKQRQISKLREKYFQQNGGNLLREQLSHRQGCSDNVKIFAAEELEKATNNYHESRILGQGGQGTVYKGILADNRMVAIKKSRIGDQSQVEPFINEILVTGEDDETSVRRVACRSSQSGDLDPRSSFEMQFGEKEFSLELSEKEMIGCFEWVAPYPMGSSSHDVSVVQESFEGREAANVMNVVQLATNQVGDEAVSHIEKGLNERPEPGLGVENVGN